MLNMPTKHVPNYDEIVEEIKVESDDEDEEFIRNTDSSFFSKIAVFFGIKTL